MKQISCYSNEYWNAIEWFEERHPELNVIMPIKDYLTQFAKELNCTISYEKQNSSLVPEYPEYMKFNRDIDYTLFVLKFYGE